MKAFFQFQLRYFILHSICHWTFGLYFFSLWEGVGWMELVTAMRFDLWMVSLFSIPLFLTVFIPGKWSKIGVLIFHAGHFALLALWAIDMGWYGFAKKHLQADLFQTEGILTEIGALSGSFFLDFWPLVVVTPILCWLVTFRLQWKPQAISLKQTPVYILTAFLIVLGIRGGFQLKPLSFAHAGEAVQNRNVDLVVNSGFSFIKTWNKQFWLPGMDGIEAREWDFPVPSSQVHSVPAPKHVILFIVESLGEENCNVKYTPFLNSLGESGARVNSFFANGTRSIEAVPAILAGIPHLFHTPWINSAHAGDPVRLLGEQLPHKTYFFHGGRNGTMGFEAFTLGAGMDRYIGLDQFPKDQDTQGPWGIHDLPFLKFMGKVLDTVQGPFISTVFTLSSHHPFEIPDDFPAQLEVKGNALQKTLRYTDWAIEQFFREFEKSPWFKNTLFVFTGDHTSLTEIPKFRTDQGKFRVPCILYGSGFDSLPTIASTGQHIDLPYTLERWLGDSSRNTMLASDLFEGAHQGVWNLVANSPAVWDAHEEGWLWSPEGIQPLKPNPPSISSEHAERKLSHFKHGIETKNW